MQRQPGKGAAGYHAGSSEYDGAGEQGNERNDDRGR